MKRPITRSVPQGLILLNIFIYDLNDKTECSLSIHNWEELVVLHLFEGMNHTEFKKRESKALHMGRNKLMH